MTENSWTEWSKHVLKELERLNDSHEMLRSKIEEVQHSLSEMKTNKDGIIELKSWKKEVDEVVSPTQLKELQGRVSNLEQFKTRAITTFLVLQGVIALVITIVTAFF